MLKELNSKSTFYSQELAREKGLPDPSSARGRLLIACLSSGLEIAQRTVNRYMELLKKAFSSEEIVFIKDIDRRFADGEVSIRIPQPVNGCDVFLFQSLFKPYASVSIDENYLAFLAAVRAFREHGARHITGILPYLAYSRQDKPTAFQREPVTARLFADFSQAAGLDRLIVWAPHCGQLRGFYGKLPVDFLDPLHLFVAEYKEFSGRQDVIVVAPDVGASKLVTYFGRVLRLNTAIASKYRPNPEEVVISEIIGDFRQKRVAIILDDMISKGETIFSLVKKLVEEKGIKEVCVGVAHNLCLKPALNLIFELHEYYNLKELVTTNSISQSEEFTGLPFIRICCLSDMLARVINRIHFSLSISELFLNSG